MPTKNLYCIIGESGSGKTTLVNRLRDYGYEPVPSYTDRAPRYPGEEGHTFLTTEEFNAMRDRMIAYTVFDGHQYGVTADLLSQYDTYVIDPNGVEYLRQHYTDRPIKVIYVTASEGSRRTRILKRGDSVEDAERRLEHDRAAFATAEDMADIVVRTFFFTERGVVRFFCDNIEHWECESV